MSGTTSSAPSKARSEYVDYLRGVSILLVMASHFAYLARILSLAGRGSVLAVAGYQGVVVFFVLSGYLITSRIFTRYGSLSSVHLREFYAMRAGRILPGMALALALLSVLALLHISNFEVPDLGRRLWYAFTFRYNRYRLDYTPEPLAWAILWSLSIEEVFYLFYPLLCRALRRTGVLVAVLVAIAVYGTVFRFVASHGSIDVLFTYSGSLCQLAIGLCLAAIACLRLPPLVKRHGLWLAAVGAFAVYSGIGGVVRERPADLGSTIVALGAAAILIGTHGRQPTLPRAWRKALGLTLLASAGELTYETYLFHAFLIPMVFAFAYPDLNGGGKVWLFGICATMAYLALTFGVANIVANRWSIPVGRAVRRWVGGQRTEAPGPEVAVKVPTPS